MLNIEGLTFTDEVILNGGVFVLVKMVPAICEKTQERIGTDLVVALTGHNYEKIRVRVTYPVTCSAFDSLAIQRIVFTEFKGHFIRDEAMDDWLFQATAADFQVIT